MVALFFPDPFGSFGQVTGSISSVELRFDQCCSLYRADDRKGHDSLWGAQCERCRAADDGGHGLFHSALSNNDGLEPSK